MLSSLRVLSVAAVSFLLCLSTAAWSQSKTFVYTANALDDSISIYSFNSSTGALVPSGGSPFPANFPNYLTAALGGKYLAVSGGECPSCGLQTFSINTGTGALKFSHAYEQIGSVIFQAAQIASDASGASLYADGSIQANSGNTVTCTAVLAALRVNSDGSLTQLGTPFAFPAGTACSAEGPLAVDHQGRWVFALVPNQNTETVFTIKRHSDGSLGPAISSVNITGQKCNNDIDLPTIAIDPQGKNLFLSCDATASAGFTGLQDYEINQTTGALSRVESFASRTMFEGLSSDRNGWRIFATSEESNLIEVFGFNRPTHAITPLNGGVTHKTGAQPNGVAVDPGNRFVYVTNGGFCFARQVAEGNCTDQSSANISGYSFNYTKGTLTALPGSPFPSRPGTRSLTFVTVP
jgi:6-phosphogluconolactonase (cycloisomerase 2 family)